MDEGFRDPLLSRRRWCTDAPGTVPIVAKWIAICGELGRSGRARGVEPKQTFGRRISKLIVAGCEFDACTSTRPFVQADSRICGAEDGEADPGRISKSEL